VIGGEVIHGDIITLFSDVGSFGGVGGVV
jgi:hypothetical protein